MKPLHKFKIPKDDPRQYARYARVKSDVVELVNGYIIIRIPTELVFAYSISAGEDLYFRLDMWGKANFHRAHAFQRSGDGGRIFTPLDRKGNIIGPSITALTAMPDNAPWPSTDKVIPGAETPKVALEGIAFQHDLLTQISAVTGADYFLLRFYGADRIIHATPVGSDFEGINCWFMPCLADWPVKDEDDE